MNKIFTLVCFIVLSIAGIGAIIAGTQNKKNSDTFEIVEKAVAEQNISNKNNDSDINNLNASELYEKLDIKNIVSFAAFNKALEGYNKIDNKKKNILTVIDFTKPSNKERMCVIDMDNNKVLHSTVVAHGKNSGELYATSFSNVNGSNKSSLGFYVTSETYQGGNGYSLRLDGLEKGINDRARERAIVIHGAAYANKSVAANGRRLGRSLGCPALPVNVNKPIINTIKDGSVLFIYAENTDYSKNSEFVS